LGLRGRELSVGVSELELPVAPPRLLRLARCPEFIQNLQVAEVGQQVKVSGAGGRRHGGSAEQRPEDRAMGVEV
jgi:hypothetical protein